MNTESDDELIHLWLFMKEDGIIAAINYETDNGSAARQMYEEDYGTRPANAVLRKVSPSLYQALVLAAQDLKAYQSLKRLLFGLPISKC